MGDTVLRLGASALAHVVRAGRHAGAAGGDEFTILMRGKPSPQELQQFLDRLLQIFRHALCAARAPMVCR